MRISLRELIDWLVSGGNALSDAFNSRYLIIEKYFATKELCYDLFLQRKVRSCTQAGAADLFARPGIPVA
jgi:hypothetical protein